MEEVRNLLDDEFKKQGYFEIESDLEQMSFILKWFARTFPFENIDVISNKEHPITPEFLINKMLKERRGGLCYELNGMLYLVLKAFEFDVTLGSATVWSEADEDWIIDKTHTVIFYQPEDNLYLLDSGSGSNLAMQPLKLNGESVTSPVGTFRLRTKKSERGTIISEKLTDNGWVLRYALYLEEVTWDDLNRIKNMIFHHEESPFNTDLLIAQTYNDGTLSITNSRLYRKWNNGEENRIPFDNNIEMLTEIEKNTNPSIYKAAEHYINNK